MGFVPVVGAGMASSWALTEAISLSSAAIDWLACALIWPCSAAMYDATTAFALAAANSAVGMVTKTWVVLLVPAAAPVCGLMVSPEWIWSPETLAPLTLAFTMAAAP